MSKSSKTRSVTSAVGKVQQLFGPPQLLEGEDPTAYEEILSRVTTAVKPVDIIDAMFTDDVVARWRRFKTILIRMRGRSALAEFLSKHLPYGQFREQFANDLAEILQDHLGEDQDAVQLADRCAQSEQEALDKVCQILKGSGRSLDEILKGSTRARARVRTA